MKLFPILLLGSLAGLTALLLRREKKARLDFFASACPPGQLVEMGGYRLHLLSQGPAKTGQPTVVLISGHGDWSRCWRSVQPEVAQFARVVAYDRPGYGWSDDSPHPRTPYNMVSDLHALLERSGETGPYLLVGHSMGAALSRLFYNRYPKQVAGMVWVDPAHEDMAAFIPFWRHGFSGGLLLLLQLGRLLAQMGLVRRYGAGLILANYPASSDPAEQATLLGQTVTAQFFRELIGDTLMLSQAANWGGLPQSLGDLPVISIEAQYSTTRPAWVNRAAWQKFITGWRAMQSDLHRLSTNFRSLRADSGHNVMHEQPHLVIKAVQDVLEQVVRRSP